MKYLLQTLVLLIALFMARLTSSYAQWSTGQSDLSGQSYDIGLNIGGAPTANQILAFACPRTITFPVNFTTPTARVSCGTNPAEPDDYLVRVNSVQIGDISLSTSCVATLTTVGGLTKTCTAGQRLELDAPATVSGANIAITLVGIR
jgi:hypothetical protein